MGDGTERAVRLGVIGGSGVYQMEGVEPVEEHTVETPFGSPSERIVETRIGVSPDRNASITASFSDAFIRP